MIEQILQYARLTPELEICGLIVIFKGREKFIPCRNTHEFPKEAFKIHEHDWAKVEDMGEIVKIVHSHPTTSHQPSPADLVGIEKTNLPWIIVNPVTGKWSETLPSGYKQPLIGRNYLYGIFDCYTLTQDYYKSLGVNLPDVKTEYLWWERGEHHYEDNWGKFGFKEIDIEELIEHDMIIFFNQSTVPNHAAIYLGNNMILHHLIGRLSSKDVYGDYWIKSTWKCLRHVDLIKS